MYQSENNDISISGRFDKILQDKCPDHPKINWQLLKALAFYESELIPFVDGGLFRIPDRLYYEYDGINSQDPEDSVKTIYNILSTWYKELDDTVKEDEKLLFVLLTYKMRFSHPREITKISTNFSELFSYISPGVLLDVRRIVDKLELY